MNSRDIIQNKINGYILKYTSDKIENSIIRSQSSGDLSSVLLNSYDILSSKKFVNPRFAMSYNNNIFGYIKLFFKRVIRRIVRPYVEPICVDQNNFNDTVSDFAEKTILVINEILNNENELKQKNIQISSDFNQMNERYMNNLKQVYDKYSLLSQQYNMLIDQQLNTLVKMDDSQMKPLGEFDKRTTAQSGEDAIILYILFALGLNISNLHYLDLGANHAKKLSNTFMLYEYGARGVLVEANPDLITELKMTRPEDVVLNNCVAPEGTKAVKFYIFNGDGLSTPDYNAAQNIIKQNPQLEIVDTVEVNTLSINKIFADYFPKAPEVVSIDIEGTETEILDEIDFLHYRPLLIIIETIPYKPHLVWNEKKVEIIKFMQDKDYVEYAFTGINSIFIDSKKLKELII
jgi:FkbM family methyltransferase